MGILLYRLNKKTNQAEVLLAHCGGPYWEHKDDGAWSIPKGRPLTPAEDPQVTAIREFGEEVGQRLDLDEIREQMQPLGISRSSKGNKITIWAVEGDFDLKNFSSNLFTMEWPRESGQIQQFPEMDKADWFDVDTARIKMFPYQAEFIDRLEELLDKE